jgi:hypothetical protein
VGMGGRRSFRVRVGSPDEDGLEFDAPLEARICPRTTSRRRRGRDWRSSDRPGTPCGAPTGPIGSLPMPSRCSSPWFRRPSTVTTKPTTSLEPGILYDKMW